MLRGDIVTKTIGDASLPSIQWRRRLDSRLGRDLVFPTGEAPARSEVEWLPNILRRGFAPASPRRGGEVVSLRCQHDALLTNCRKAMTTDATLLIVERVLTEKAAHGRAADSYLLDLEMLVNTPGGRERTEAEFRAIFTTAGSAL